MGCTDLIALCGDYCRQEGLEEPSLQADEGITCFEIQRQGVAVSVIHNARTVADAAFVLVELGAAPAAASREAARALLAANYLFPNDPPITFACRPRDDMPVLAVSIPLSELDGSRLGRILDFCVPQALIWREACAAADQPGACA